MDPLDPTSFNHRTERLATGHTYHFVDQVPEDYNPATTPTLLCVHGFPDLWYGWRYVVSPWVKQCGWRVVVPSMLGYGGTDKPISPEHYTPKSLSADLAALLDLIGAHKAVVLGHDWGAATVWRFALWYPDRIHALVALSIPFTPPRPDYLTLEQIVERLPIFGYQLYFNDPSSTKEIENNEFHYYLDSFREGGMNGPLNYYRTTKYRFDEEAAGELPTRLPASLPVLFLWGDRDGTCSPSQVERMHQHVPSLRVVRIPGKGHWLMADSADVVADSVAKFVNAVWTEPDKPKL
ncbi:alpha/beta-hydrolase [Gautieria morchelliformis]|nr:alpha/beta-hydrolase [Gautieria morchelliformis]